jgi:flagellar biosynthetic protein FliR
MNALELFPGYVQNFLLILLRSSIVLSFLPFFGAKSIPPQFKIGFIVALAAVLTPVVEFRFGGGEIPLLVIREIIFGIILGGAAWFVFYAVDMAGQLMSNAMGFSIATLFNPEIGQSAEVSRFYGILAMLVFLATDAHHDLIYIFVKSYEWVPAGTLDLNSLISRAIALGSSVFVIALKMGAPVIILMLITNLLLGFISKAAPQMNIFFVAHPVYLFLGFLVMLMGIPVFLHVSSGYFSTIRDEMARVIGIAKV